MTVTRRPTLITYFWPSLLTIRKPRSGCLTVAKAVASLSYPWLPVNEDALRLHPDGAHLGLHLVRYKAATEQYSESGLGRLPLRPGGLAALRLVLGSATAREI